MYTIHGDTLTQVAGSLIVSVGAELSMRALESAYLNDISWKVSYRFSRQTKRE